MGNERPPPLYVLSHDFLITHFNVCFIHLGRAERDEEEGGEAGGPVHGGQGPQAQRRQAAGGRVGHDPGHPGPLLPGTELFEL